MALTWVYQLQNVDAEQQSKVRADVKVIDPFKYDDVRWTSGGVTWMRAGNNSCKMLAYLSIGEAEDYRAYWKTAWQTQKTRPIWLDRENPEWRGNFKVRFWKNEWKDIVKAQIDAIVKQGFDGIYLDIVDAYEYYEDRGIHDAGSQMIRFVTELAAHARAQSPNFWIVPQNGSGLLHDPNYADVISAIGVEDVFYNQPGEGRANSGTITLPTTTALREAVTRRKPVLAVEYGLNTAQRKLFIKACDYHGFSPYITTRELNALRPVVLEV